MEQVKNDYAFKNLTSMNHKLYQKGKILYHEETPSSGIYLIISGTVKLYHTDRNGREVILRLARRGDILGYEYLFGKNGHSASAKAVEESVCQFIEGNEFQALMANNPAIHMMIIKKLNEELCLFQNRCLELIKKNVRERLANYFHYMAEHHGEIHEKGIRIRIQLSREEIASLIGTANETTIRFISEFKELGLVFEEDRIFYITDKERLAQIAKIESQLFLRH
jgi:CRP-like cAMP-binding protein